MVKKLLSRGEVATGSVRSLCAHHKSRVDLVWFVLFPWASLPCRPLVSLFLPPQIRCSASLSSFSLPLHLLYHSPSAIPAALAPHLFVCWLVGGSSLPLPNRRVAVSPPPRLVLCVPAIVASKSYHFDFLHRPSPSPLPICVKQLANAKIYVF